MGAIRLVHFSTDYVFGLDATRTTPYAESDSPGPVNVYGLSKLTGEYLVRAECPTALVIRTCGLYGLRGTGGKGTNFVESMLHLAGEGKPIRVVNDQRCTPTNTQDLAEATASLIGARATWPLSRYKRELVHLERVRGGALPPQRVETESHFHCNGGACLLCTPARI